jgi:hypothetical protein
VESTTAAPGTLDALRRVVTAGLLPLSALARTAIRVAGAALLVGNGALHWHLADLGYATVPVIGPLFRLDGVIAVLVAVAVLVTPMPWWRFACAAGALLQVGTLGALGLSLTVGTFGFRETLDAPDLVQSVVVETLGFAVLVIGALARTPVSAGE